jgi:hypothetical protein
MMSVSHLYPNTMLLLSLLSGPGGADMTMWKGEQAQKFAGLQPLAPFAAMMTAHFYTARATAPGANTSTFLAESVVSHLGCNINDYLC